MYVEREQVGDIEVTYRILDDVKELAGYPMYWISKCQLTHVVCAHWVKLGKKLSCAYYAIGLDKVAQVKGRVEDMIRSGRDIVTAREHSERINSEALGAE